MVKAFVSALAVFALPGLGVAASEVVSQTQETEEIGPFVSYDTTVSLHVDGTTTVKYGKPRWGGPMIDATLNGAVDAVSQRVFLTFFSDEYTGPVISEPYFPPGIGEKFLTTDRDGKVMSTLTRTKLNARILGR